jgi:hypothetical protein
MKRKLLTILVLLAFVLMGFVASQTLPDDFSNLKVLSKNISKQQLDKVMDEFKDALGVKCSFCHVHKKDNPREWDFASDEKPEKTVARKMITMANKINKKFFHGKAKYGEENALMEVHCVTCHHGQPHPEILQEEHEKPKQ